MRYAKMLLWVFIAIFLVVGLFKDGITNFSDAIVLILLGTLLFVESIEHKNNKGKDGTQYWFFVKLVDNKYNI